MRGVNTFPVSRAFPVFRAQIQLPNATSASLLFSLVWSALVEPIILDSLAQELSHNRVSLFFAPFCLFLLESLIHSCWSRPPGPVDSSIPVRILDRPSLQLSSQLHTRPRPMSVHGNGANPNSETHGMRQSNSVLRHNAGDTMSSRDKQWTICNLQNDADPG